MIEARIHHATLPNGLTVLCEAMPAVRSAAYALLVPAGAIHDPPVQLGTAAVLAEWMVRGAGERSARELLSALDELGVSHGESAQTPHLSLVGASIGASLVPALGIVADMVQRPHLPDSEFEPIQSLLVQSLRSIEDDPASKASIELRRVHYPDPWGRPTQGTIEGVSAVEMGSARAHFRRFVQPSGALLAVAGAVDWDHVRDVVEHLFGGWAPGAEPVVKEQPTDSRRVHLTKETQQIQIGTAIAAADPKDPHYYQARAAAAVLGGYSSSRLFTEVREKRGLCYSIHASYESVRAHSALICGAASAPDRAQETLDVLRQELARLCRDGVASEELETMRAGLKASLIMQQESSSARAMALVGDWYYLGRVRPIAEIAEALDMLSARSVSEYCATLPIDDGTYVTLGPRLLEFNA